jgi:hypothetical protein
VLLDLWLDLTVPALPSASFRSWPCHAERSRRVTPPSSCRRRASQVSSVQRGPERSSASSAFPIAHGHPSRPANPPRCRVSRLVPPGPLAGLQLLPFCAEFVQTKFVRPRPPGASSSSSAIQPAGRKCLARPSSFRPRLTGPSSRTSTGTRTSATPS